MQCVIMGSPAYQNTVQTRDIASVKRYVGVVWKFVFHRCSQQVLLVPDASRVLLGHSDCHPMLRWGAGHRGPVPSALWPDERPEALGVSVDNEKVNLIVKRNSRGVRFSETV